MLNMGQVLATVATARGNIGPQVLYAANASVLAQAVAALAAYTDPTGAHPFYRPGPVTAAKHGVPAQPEIVTGFILNTEGGAALPYPLHPP
eukprot:m.377018 g.377018  ORF g.377018 m.377018 type:complete len:91 (+) comp16705_c1_seq2:1128-1400(+)